MSAGVIGTIEKERAMRFSGLAVVLCVGILFVAHPALAAPAGADEAGFVSMFNGKDLTGWEGDSKLWSVKDGCIVGQTTAESPIKTNTFLIWRTGKPGDFTLRFSYRIENHNSGVQYRSHEVEGVPFGMGGYQADILGDGSLTGIVYEERGRGILAKVGEKVSIKANGKLDVVGQTGDAAKLTAGVKLKDWNDYEVIAEGNHVIQKINGQAFSEFTDDQADKRAMDGLIGLQLHAGAAMKVEFKDLRVKELKAAGKP
jgi:hypothetical protein